MVHRKAGLGSYARELATHLAAGDPGNTYSLFHYDRNPPAALPEPLNRLALRTVALSARPWRLSVAARHLAGLPMDATFPDVDLFHATEHLLPPLRRIRTVFTFHDAIYALFPQFHLPMNRLFLGLMMPRFLPRASAVVTISECSKRDAVRLYGLDPDRLQVIYEGVDPRFQPNAGPDRRLRLRQTYALPEQYVLYVGTIEPRKNLVALLDAYAALLQSPTPGLQSCGLVIVGRKGWLYQGFFQRLKQLGLEGRVILPGYVADEDLPVLYGAADLFAFPSLYEGFGLPVLEAMACGTPVVCADASSLPEIAGDAALLVPPTDVKALAGAMERLISDAELRRELRGRGLVQASRFTWERTATQTLGVYERAMRGA